MFQHKPTGSVIKLVFLSSNIRVPYNHYMDTIHMNTIR